MKQVGKVICPAASRLEPARDLRGALSWFDSGPDRRDRDMLFGLRCAFAHEFAMAHEGRKVGWPARCATDSRS
jgi:hypothetical protein